MNEISVIEREQEYELMKKQAGAFYRSGFFPDLKSYEQAVVKVMVGKELGVNPFASITGIHVVNGKPVIGANLIATMIANHPTYNYRVVKSTKEICEIAFYDSKDKTVNKGTWVGNISFTIQEAQEAGLLGKDNWKKYTSDMLFARAISRGAKRYTPGIFGGTAVYTPDEMGVDTDADGVIQAPNISISHTHKAMAKKKCEICDKIYDENYFIEYRSVTGEVGDGDVEDLECCKSCYEPSFGHIIGSDEAIIEEIKQTHVISEGGL